PAERPDPGARAVVRARRDRRALPAAPALDVLPPAASGAAALPRLRERRAGLLPAHENLPDHAHGGDPPRCLREEPLGGAIALQGARGGKIARARALPADRRHAGDAPVARPAPPRSTAGERRGTVARRGARQPAVPPD